MARPIPPATLHRIFGESTPWNSPESYEREHTPVPLDEAVFQRIRERLSGKPVHVRIGYFSTLAADFREAFESPSFTFFVGGVTGSMLVCVLAFFWSAL